MPEKNCYPKNINLQTVLFIYVNNKLSYEQKLF